MSQRQSIITVSGQGPVILHSFAVPDRGGVVLLRGKNESGKSSTLDAVNTLLTGRGKLNRNDDADEAVVEGFGAKVRMLKSPRRTGNGTDDLGVVHVQDDFDLEAFVHPSVADARAKAERRIKSLVRLSGATLSMADFEALVPISDQYPPVSLSAAAAETDTVDRAGKVKRLIEAEARRIEGLSQDEMAKKAADEQAAGEVDLSSIPVEAEDRQRHMVAASALAALQERQRAYHASNAARLAAQDQMEQARLAYRGPSVSVANATLAEAATAKATADDFVRHLEEQLLVAKAQAAQAEIARLLAAKDVAAATDHVATLERLQAAIAAQSPELPSESALAAAEQRLKQAEQDVALGVRIRDAAKKMASAIQHEHVAKAHDKRSQSLRDAAKAIDQLLSRAIVSDLVAVKCGELLYTGEGREESFDRLSDGARYRVALSIATQRLSERDGSGTRLFVLSQSGWQDLDPDRKEELDALCRELGVVILTAECARGPLRTVVYGESDPFDVAMEASV